MHRFEDEDEDEQGSSPIHADGGLSGGRSAYRVAGGASLKSSSLRSSSLRSASSSPRASARGFGSPEDGNFMSQARASLLCLLSLMYFLSSVLLESLSPSLFLRSLVSLLF